MTIQSEHEGWELLPLPCPFCGAEAQFSVVEFGHTHDRHNVGCGTSWCRGNVTLHNSRDEAIAAWNRRSPPVSGGGPSPDLVLEKAARIIDPDAWAYFDDKRADGQRMTADVLRFDAWKQSSLTKARAILAMLSALGGGGLPPVERIECVSYSEGYEHEAEPLWRICVNGYCADFETEQRANNFRSAILSHLGMTEGGGP